MVDYLNEKYSVTDVMEHMLEYEKRTGESFLDSLLREVNGKEIKICRETEIKGAIVVDENYDCIFVLDGLKISVKKDCMINMFGNFEDYIQAYQNANV